MFEQRSQASAKNIMEHEEEPKERSTVFDSIALQSCAGAKTSLLLFLLTLLLSLLRSSPYAFIRETRGRGMSHMQNFYGYPMVWLQERIFQRASAS